MIDVVRTSETPIHKKKLNELTGSTVIVTYHGRLGITGLNGLIMFDGGCISRTSALFDSAEVEVLPPGFEVVIRQKGGKWGVD